MEVILTRSGRSALLLGLKALNFGVGDTVLIPNYICNAVLQPIRHLGLSPRFYRLDSQLNPCLEDVKEQVSLANGNTGIIVVNYFGFRQNIAPVLDYAKRCNVTVIEDNCHGHLSALGNDEIGNAGDIVVSSLRKSYLIPDGGYTLLRSVSLASGTDLNLEVDGNWPSYLSALAKSRIKTEIRKYPRLEIAIENSFEKEASCIPPLMMGTASFLASRAAKRTGHFTAQKRIQGYKKAAAHLRKLGYEPMFEAQLLQGAVPYACPFQVESSQELVQVLKLLRGRGMRGHIWPTLPLELRNDKRREEALLLRRRTGIILLGHK